MTPHDTQFCLQFNGVYSHNSHKALWGVGKRCINHPSLHRSAKTTNNNTGPA